MLDFSVTFIFTLVNIFVLFVILRFILYKPVTRLIEKRAQAIQESMDNAESEKAQARGLLENYETRLLNLEAEAGEIIRRACEEAELRAEKIIASAHAAARDSMEAARVRIETERNIAMAELHAQAAALIVAAAGRLLQRELDGEDSRRQAELILRSIGNN